MGCHARSPFFQGIAKYPRPVPQSLLLKIFHFLHDLMLKYGALQVLLPAHQIHSTSHKQTLPQDLSQQKPNVLF